MTIRPSRTRLAREWLWRGQMLQDLKAHAWPRARYERLSDARACHLLAWRTLAGLEPVPARTRATVAKPLLNAGLERCASLVEPPVTNLHELFDSTEWQERFVRAGVPSERQAVALAWLRGGDSTSDANAATDALLALGAVLDALDLARHAVRRVVWRRILVLAVGAVSLFGLVSLVLLLVSPPEGPDVGAGKPWHASSFYPGFPGEGAKPVKPKEGAFFATNDEVNPWWMIDLQAPIELGSVTIVNRTDCCPDRAIPVVLELSLDGQAWREVARKTDTFRTWKPAFAPSKARYVRLRALRRTLLHFKDVRIHAAR